MPPMTSTTTSTSGSVDDRGGVGGEHAVGQRRRPRSLDEVAHGHPGDLEPQAGAGLDVVGLRRAISCDERGADVAAAEHADPHHVRHAARMRGYANALDTVY